MSFWRRIGGNFGRKSSQTDNFWDNYKEVIRAFKRLLKGNIRLLKSFLKGILKLYKAIRGFTYHLRSYYSYPSI